MMRPFHEPALAAAVEAGGKPYKDALTHVIQWSERQPALAAREHTGVQPVVKYALAVGGPERLLWSAYPHQHKLTLYFFWFPAFASGPLRAELLRRLRTIPGITDDTLPANKPSVLRLK